MEPMKLIITSDREVVIENAELRYCNFAGERRTQFDTEGDRNFTLIVKDQNIAETMTQMGYNVKLVEPTTESGTLIAPYWKLKVKVRFGSWQKPFFMYSNGVKTPLTEATIGQLDHARIEKVDLAVGLGQARTTAGVSTRTAYLNQIHAVVSYDYLGDKYASYGT